MAWVGVIAAGIREGRQLAVGTAKREGCIEQGQQEDVREAGMAYRSCLFVISVAHHECTRDLRFGCLFPTLPFQVSIAYCEAVEPADSSLADNYILDRPSINHITSSTSLKTPNTIRLVDSAGCTHVVSREESDPVLSGQGITITELFGQAGRPSD